MNSANDNGPDSERPKREPACPICGRPSAADFRPFCSKRCADVDLHRWLGGRYVVPGEPVQTEDPLDE
jgi:uncharacterized protein